MEIIREHKQYQYVQDIYNTQKTFMYVLLYSNFKYIYIYQGGLKRPCQMKKALFKRPVQRWYNLLISRPLSQNIFPEINSSLNNISVSTSFFHIEKQEVIRGS